MSRENPTTCSKCGIKLNNENWFKCHQNKKVSTCKKCDYARRSKYRHESQEYLTKEKLKTGCEICGYNKNPHVLCFHHVNPEDKEYRMNQGVTVKMLKKERKKCLVLCSNCHMEYHHPY